MSKNILDNISFDGLGLLMFLIREKDKNNIVDMGYREIARRINKSEHWIRTMVRNFTKKKLLKVVEGAPSGAPSGARKTALLVPYSITPVAPLVASSGADNSKENKFTFEDVWKTYGRIGSKKLAKDRYERLSGKKKEELMKSIPYYKAFHDPAYFAHLSTYISKEDWNNEERYEGVPIPKDNYHVANADKFVDWFNKQVQGSGIPQISGLTPARYRMLNICYTLCYQEMGKVMKVLLHNDRYIEMANKGMIDFDYIFKPVNLRKICEHGTTE